MKSLLREHYKKVVYGAIILLVMGSIGFLAVNHYVEQRGAQYLYSAQEVPGADAILILGAYVLPDGTLSLMLWDRVTTGYELYENSKAPKIIVSGDHGSQDYDEVNTMKDFIKSKGAAARYVSSCHR